MQFNSEHVFRDIFRVLIGQAHRGAQPVSYPEVQGPFPYLIPSNTENKKAWSYNFTPPYVVME
jgi:hypothetical protein